MKTATELAQQIADQELEACRKFISENYSCSAAEKLMAARRPKPPSLKEQALAVLPKRLGSGFMATINDKELEILRRALEALPND
jgi:hypothetical protein